MGFVLRTKLGNIFRSISFSEIDLEDIDLNKTNLIDKVIEKGLFFVCFQSDFMLHF